MVIRRALTALLVAALLASFLLKVWFIAATHLGEATDIRPKLLSFLSEAGFTTRTLHGGWASVAGQAGACRLVMAKVNADGWHRDIVFDTAPAGSTVVFFFRGEAFPDQPKWLTWGDEKIFQIKHAFNKEIRADWVIASTIGKACAVDKDLWAKRLARI